MITVDFETEAIRPRPYYPPKPVGVAVKEDGQPARYYAWGHPTENNCTFEEGKRVLADIWGGQHPLLMHNAKFDLEVAKVHMDLPIPFWSRVHDTQFLLYLLNPHAKSFALKPSAERLLGWAAEEQDEVRNWVLMNVVGASNAKGSQNYWAGMICMAPGDLVGRYACGDVDRTYALYQHCATVIDTSGMNPAYDRERRLLQQLLNAERRGVRFDLDNAQRDEKLYQNAWEEADRRILARLNANINLNSGDELADALLRSGAVKELPLTPKGRVSTAKDVLENAIEDRELYSLLRYRGVLKTCVSTFLSPLCRQAEENGGRVHTQWHQTRGDFDKGGTVTGRLSSIGPNFQNVPNDFSGCDVEGFPHPPLIRKYFLPERGHVWIKRDYSAQEVRVLAHFEDGALLEAFQSDPRLDPHAFAQQLIERQTGVRLDRKVVKTVAFSILYGSGAKNLSERLGVSYDEALRIKTLYLAAFPDVQGLMRDVTQRGTANLPVRTTGGRLIYVEPPLNGRTFAYKMLNHLIQGSAADVTKQAVVNMGGHWPFLATVHDEINISAPAEDARGAAEDLRKAMASVPLDAPLTSDCYVGQSWADADANKQEGW